MPLAMPQSWAFASRGLVDSGARPDSSGKGMTPPPFDCTAQPSVASMATRPCLSSDARNHFMVVGDASLPKPAGSHMTPPVSGPTPISVEPSAVRAGRGAGACSAAAPARHRARLRAISTCARRPRFLSRAPGGCCSSPPPAREGGGTRQRQPAGRRPRLPSDGAPNHEAVQQQGSEPRRAHFSSSAPCHRMQTMRNYYPAISYSAGLLPRWVSGRACTQGFGRWYRYPY